MAPIRRQRGGRGGPGPNPAAADLGFGQGGVVPDAFSRLVGTPGGLIPRPPGLHLAGGGAPPSQPVLYRPDPAPPPAVCGAEGGHGTGGNPHGKTPRFYPLSTFKGLGGLIFQVSPRPLPRSQRPAKRCSPRGRRIGAVGPALPPKKNPRAPPSPGGGREQAPREAEVKFTPGRPSRRARGAHPHPGRPQQCSPASSAPRLFTASAPLAHRAPPSWPGLPPPPIHGSASLRIPPPRTK